METLVPIREAEDWAPVAQAYLFFARSLSYPKREFYELLASEETQAWLRDLLSDLPFTVTIDGDLRFASPWEEIEPEYIDNFDIVPLCPLYEGLTRTDQTRQEVLIELLRLYEHFGVELREEQRDFPDHLCVEIEFMAYLAQAESQATESWRQLQALRLAQRDFLERHLLVWVPILNQKVASSTGEPFYVKAVKGLDDFLRKHHEYLQGTVATGGVL